jgi:16S rRNA (uracil1498-N3)-methyltransferase
MGWIALTAGVGRGDAGAGHGPDCGGTGAFRRWPFFRLFQAIPKGDTFEWIIEKAGVGCGRGCSVSCAAERGAGAHRTRGGQNGPGGKKLFGPRRPNAGAADLPAVAGPLEFDEVLGRFGPADASFLAWEGEEAVSFKDGLAGRGLGGKAREGGASGGASAKQEGSRMIVNIVVGPEGGFTTLEVDRARARGAATVSLGPRVLRTETAGLFMASALLYESLS